MDKACATPSQIAARRGGQGHRVPLLVWELAAEKDRIWPLVDSLWLMREATHPRPCGQQKLVLMFCFYFGFWVWAFLFWFGLVFDRKLTG